MCFHRHFELYSKITWTPDSEHQIKKVEGQSVAILCKTGFNLSKRHREHESNANEFILQLLVVSILCMELALFCFASIWNDIHFLKMINEPQICTSFHIDSAHSSCSSTLLIVIVNFEIGQGFLCHYCLALAGLMNNCYEM